MYVPDRVQYRGLGSMAKRTFDFLAATAGLVLFAVPIFLMAIAVRMGSRGPALFRQKRVGRNGRTFTCYKLRTMRQGTGNLPSHELTADAITPIGAKLRRLKLDELPQLWNVLCGDMSLVGPRPCLPSQSELIDARNRLGVLRFRPGITGVAQIAGIDMSDPQRLAAADALYSPSLLTDLRLVFLTVVGAGRGDAVRELGHNSVR